MFIMCLEYLSLEWLQFFCAIFLVFWQGDDQWNVNKKFITCLEYLNLEWLRFSCAIFPVFLQGEDQWNVNKKNVYNVFGILVFIIVVFGINIVNIHCLCQGENYWNVDMKPKCLK